MSLLHFFISYLIFFLVPVFYNIITKRWDGDQRKRYKEIKYKCNRTLFLIYLCTHWPISLISYYLLLNGQCVNTNIIRGTTCERSRIYIFSVIFYMAWVIPYSLYIYLLDQAILKDKTEKIWERSRYDSLLKSLRWPSYFLYLSSNGQHVKTLKRENRNNVRTFPLHFLFLCPWPINLLSLYLYIEAMDNRNINSVTVATSQIFFF